METDQRRCIICGIYGWAAKDDSGPNMTILKRVAANTELRGAHAFGFAWIDADGRLRSYKAQGRITRHLDLLDQVRNARLMIGHCRYATHGSPERDHNNHPFPAHGGWYVHNGVIRDYLRVYARYRVRPRTECDSEVLGHLIRLGQGSVLQRCLAAVGDLDEAPLTMLGLWSRPGRLVAIRRAGQPLHCGGTRTGTYLASLPDALPGQVQEFPDDFGLCAGPRGVVHAHLETGVGLRTVENVE